LKCQTPGNDAKELRNMTAETDHRVDIRIKHRAEIQFENYYSETNYYAKMYN